MSNVFAATGHVHYAKKCTTFFTDDAGIAK